MEKPLLNDMLRGLALSWQERRKQLFLKPGSVRHNAAQLHFFCGAFVALQHAGIEYADDPLLVLAFGHDSVELWAKEK